MRAAHAQSKRDRAAICQIARRWIATPTLKNVDVASLKKSHGPLFSSGQKVHSPMTALVAMQATAIPRQTSRVDRSGSASERQNHCASTNKGRRVRPSHGPSFSAIFGPNQPTYHVVNTIE